MNYKISFKKIILFLLVSSFYFIFGCGKEPLFDRLAENQVKVIIKCTYESNTPRPWTSPSDYTDDNSVIFGSSNGVSDTNPTTFMLDIAGLQISSRNTNQYFAPYRKTYSASVGDNSSPLFNGTGVVYENDDVRPGHWFTNVGMFIRKMMFDSAKDYVLDHYVSGGITQWAFIEDVETYFHEKKVNAYNFNVDQVLTYYDYLKDNYLSINRIFPLNIPVEDGFIYDPDDPETVLEIRLVVKNFIKKYEYEYKDSDDLHRLRRYYALSDWLRDIIWDEANQTTYTGGRLGGNLIGVARCYVPGRTATITGDATVATGSRYIIAINANHTVAEYNFTPQTRPTCDEPKKPRSPLLPASPTDTDYDNYLQAFLDYYLQYEVYKANYDNFKTCMDTGTTYADDWDTYDSTTNEFKIPPIITFSNSDGSFILTNVPVGQTYTLYESNITTVSELPTSFTDLSGFSGPTPVTVTIDESCAGGNIRIQPTTVDACN